jgi:hypothetical protein
MQNRDSIGKMALRQQPMGIFCLSLVVKDMKNTDS